MPYKIPRGRTPGSRLALDSVPEVIRRLEAGESLNGACTRLGFHYGTIARVIHEQRPGLISPPRKRFIPKSTKRAVVTAYLSGEGSYEVLARRFEVSPMSVQRWVSRHYGIEV